MPAMNSPRPDHHSQCSHSRPYKNVAMVVDAPMAGGWVSDPEDDIHHLTCRLPEPIVSQPEIPPSIRASIPTYEEAIGTSSQASDYFPTRAQSVSDANLQITPLSLGKPLDTAGSQNRPATLLSHYNSLSRSNMRNVLPLSATPLALSQSRHQIEPLDLSYRSLHCKNKSNKYRAATYEKNSQRLVASICCANDRKMQARQIRNPTKVNGLFVTYCEASEMQELENLQRDLEAAHLDRQLADENVRKLQHQVRLLTAQRDRALQSVKEQREEANTQMRDEKIIRNEYQARLKHALDEVDHYEQLQEDYKRLQNRLAALELEKVETDKSVAALHNKLLLLEKERTEKMIAQHKEMSIVKKQVLDLEIEKSILKTELAELKEKQKSADTAGEYKYFASYYLKSRVQQ